MINFFKKSIVIYAPNYPSEGDYYKSAFIHTRAKEYKKKGYIVEIIVPSKEDLDYTFEGITVKRLDPNSHLKYISNKKFDIVISCECFEHAKNWKKIFQSMYNVCKANGFVIFTCASRGRIEHGTARTINSDSPGTDDSYYKNIFKREFEKSFNINKLLKQSLLHYNIKSSDLYFFGSKEKNFKIDIQKINEAIKLIKNRNRKIKIFRNWT